MPVPEALLPEAAACLADARSILVASHLRPDGDAIGSVLGMGLALQAAGKDVQMVLSDGLPASYRHLEGSQQVRSRPEAPFDFSIVLDCSDLTRLGHALNDTLPDLNIDHHITNLCFARFNLIDTGAVATAEIVAGLLPAFNLPLTLPVAAALLTGIVTDTLGFRTSNMTPRALRIAADLMELGANLPELYQRSLIWRSFEASRYWGKGLAQLERDGRLIWATLTLVDREAVGYPGRDDADLINVLSSITDADISIIFVEQTRHRVKVSWRAQPGFDVSQIALKFGGGGHPAASGAEIMGDLETVKRAVLEATRTLLNGR